MRLIGYVNGIQWDHADNAGVLQLELRHLRYFIKAAELLHFTKAAEALYISQPTLSTHIQQLEEELGTQLFARVGRNVRLTEAGQLFLLRAQSAVHELAIATEEIGAVTGLLRGSLTIAALPLFSSSYLPKWITEFNSLYPNVHVKARSGASEDVEEGVASGVIDLGFAILPLEHAEFNWQELFSDEIALAVAKNHPLAKKKNLQIEDLNGLEIAMPSQRIATARLAKQYFNQYEVHPTVIVEFDDGNALAAMARSGRFGALLPSGAFVNDRDMVCFPLPQGSFRYTSAAIWTHLSPAAKAFLDVATSDPQHEQSAKPAPVIASGN